MQTNASSDLLSMMNITSMTINNLVYTHAVAVAPDHGNTVTGYVGWSADTDY